MSARRMGKLWLIAFALVACSAEGSGPASVAFPVDGSIEAAWGQARVTNGVEIDANFA